MLNNFSQVEGSPCQKQVQVIKAIVELKHGREAEKSVGTIVRFVCALEHDYFNNGMFDEQIESIKSDILINTNNDIVAASKEQKSKRAVILDNPGMLDEQIIKALVDEERFLFVVRGKLLKEILVKGNSIEEEPIMEVHSLREAVSIIKDDDMEVRIVSDSRDRLVEITLPEVLPGCGVLVFAKNPMLPGATV